MGKLDHNPTLLTEHITGQGVVRPFRYENMWHLHHEFRDAVLRKWGAMPEMDCHLRGNLVLLAEHLTQWNRHSFGNIIMEPRSLRRRIEGIQRHRQYLHSDYLQNIEWNLIAEYDHKLIQEEGPKIPVELASSWGLQY